MSTLVMQIVERAPMTISRFRFVPFVAICFLAALVAISAIHAPAQQATASVNGTVKDQSGAVLPGAKVTLRNLSTNVARTLTTTKDGNYVFTLVPIGA